VAGYFTILALKINVNLINLLVIVSIQQKIRWEFELPVTVPQAHSDVHSLLLHAQTRILLELLALPAAYRNPFKIVSSAQS